MKRVFDSPFLNKAALVLIWLLLMGGTFFYANKNYFLYHENPNLIKADGYYLYNFGSPRHYYWALPVKFTHEGKVYHSQLPLDIRDESSSCTVDLRIYIPADSSGSAFAFRNNITINNILVNTNIMIMSAAIQIINAILFLHSRYFILGLT